MSLIDHAVLSESSSARPRPSTSHLPTVRVWLRDWFVWYAERHYLRKDFHGLWCAKQAPPPVLDDRPLILYANHPSWWDPLVAMFVMRRFYPQRPYFAPIDAEALERYKIFQSLGFYGVERDSRRGAVNFLNTSRAVLALRRGSLLITPTGRMHDVRERPLEFEPGIGHLARGMDEGVLLPMSVEYPFWDERTPEALLYFGSPIDVADHSGLSAGEWTALLRDRLAEAMDRAAALAQTRDPANYDPLITGRVGIGGVYDAWRRGVSWLTGRRFEAGHGDLTR